MKRLLTAPVVLLALAACHSEHVTPVIPSTPPATSVEPKVEEPSGFKCQDGTHSYAKHRQGACSRHGGIG